MESFVNPADTRMLGRGTLDLPVLGIGTAPLGWLYEDVADSDANATILHALERGIGYIDTAPSYGLGRAETRVGEALQSAHGHGRPIISTKVGRVLAAGRPATEREFSFPGSSDLVAVEAWDSAGIRQSLEQSLERLQVDSVDIAFIHDPDFFEDAVYETAWPALAELREAGVVKAIGFGMNSWEMPARFVSRLDVDILLIAGRYNLLDTSAADVLFPLCIERGTSVVCGGVLGTGILATGDPGAHHNYGAASPQILERVAAIKDVCRQHSTPLSAVAVQFPLAHPAVASVVVGMRSPSEVDENIDALTFDIPPALWTDLIASGALPAGIPVPC
jgi:D-threo-aldose 1-dehydrogenase